MLIFYTNICCVLGKRSYTFAVPFIKPTFRLMSALSSSSQKSPSGEVEDIGGWRNTVRDSICRNEHLLPPLPPPAPTYCPQTAANMLSDCDSAQVREGCAPPRFNAPAILPMTTLRRFRSRDKSPKGSSSVK